MVARGNWQMFERRFVATLLATVNPGISMKATLVGIWTIDWATAHSKWHGIIMPLEHRQTLPPLLSPQ